MKHNNVTINMLTEVKTVKLPVRQRPLCGLYNKVDEL
jgi:hypothetical protein